MAAGLVADLLHHRQCVRYLRTGSPAVVSIRGNVNACTAFQAKTARAAGVITGNRDFARSRILPRQYA